MVDERKVEQLQKTLDNKIKLANQMEGRVAELVGKQKDDTHTIKLLKEEIENQRRKSTADQGLIRKLQKMVDEKSRQADDDLRRQTSLQSEIRAIQ